MRQVNGVMAIEDPRRGLLGYVAIDSTMYNASCGGLRMDAETTVEELKALARTMTIKYAFIGMPQGGAKAVLLFDPEETPPEEKREIFIAAGRALAPILKYCRYQTGTDLGTTHDDIELLLRAAGVKQSVSRVDSGFFTALTAFLFAERFAGEMELQTVAIEGFGKVGAPLAQFFVESGRRVVAVSTRAGAIYREEGLPIAALHTLRERYGSAFVRHARNVRHLPKEELLTLPVDILCPCAKSWSIHEGNAPFVRARLIVAGANIPITEKAEEMLHAGGSIVIPDFAANCGGVLSGILCRLNDSASETEKAIRRMFPSNIEGVLAHSRERGIPIAAAAREIALQSLEHARREERSPRNLPYRAGLWCLRRDLIPRPLVRGLGRIFVRRHIEA
jgi:glutamate dehydrogenase/leucine dehydrogenase